MSNLTPIKIVIPYWIFCLLLYAFGPFKWVTYHPVTFWTLNILFLLLFSVGWILGIRLKSATIYRWNSYDPNDARILKGLHIKIVINCIYEAINLFRMFFFSSFDVTGLIKRLIYGIQNMGDSYNSFQESIMLNTVNVVGGSLMTMFNVVWDFWAFSTLLLSILYLKRLNIIDKIITGITLFIIIIGYVARGTNIGVFRIVLAFLCFFYIKYIKKSKEKSKKKKISSSKMLVLSVVGIVVVVQLFDKVMQSRGGINLWETSYYNIGGIGINKNSIFFSIVPLGFHQLVVALASYLTQGFYGMSLTLRVPWKPMFGLGSSMGLQNLLTGLIPNLTSRTYQKRIEIYGWDSYVQWHTMYSWIANDFSYIGVIFIMAVLGFLFAKVYKDCMNDNNPFAYLMLYYLVLMAVFLPCNNQVFQSTYVLFSFILVFVKWLLSRKGIVIKIGDRIRI